MGSAEKFVHQFEQCYPVLRAREKFIWKNDQDLAHHIEFAKKRYFDCQNKKSRTQMKNEISLCKKFWKCNTYYDYLLYDLYRIDKNFSELQLINYIPFIFYYKIFRPYHCRERESILVDNKLITEKMFRSLGISQPETLFKLIDGHFYSETMQKTQFSDIQRKISDNSWSKIFVKPAIGLGGYGTYVFKRNEDGLYITKDNIVFTEAFLNEIGIKQDYIVQPGVEQHHKMSEIYPHSINTFRVMTEYKDGSAEVLCAFLRIGRGNTDVDNASQNGLITGINTDTGELNNFAMSYYSREYFQRHPDTGFAFKNFNDNIWNGIRNFSIEAAEKFPQFQYLGWDIGLSKTGPIAIETNRNFCITAPQIVLGGLREQFRIENPDYYWKNLNKSPCHSIY